MSGRHKAALFLTVLGCVVLLANAMIHLIAGARTSNLPPGLQPAFRTVFVLVGWDWIVTGIIALIASFSATKLGRAIVLISGLSLLGQAAITARFLGWFAGTDLIFAAGLLISCGGALFQPASG
jgi:hypothetical protein